MYLKVYIYNGFTVLISHYFQIPSHPMANNDIMALLSCLSGLLIEDFGSKLQPCVLLIDPKLHKFEAIVIK